MLRRLVALLTLAALTACAPAAHHDRPTPYLGWNTYFSLGGDPTEAEVRAIAADLVATGLRDAGYRIVWIDGNWAAPVPRDSTGRLVADPARFPSGLRALTDDLHALGFQAGIYTDAGPYLPGTCGLGSHGHYRADVRQFAAWGFDALKADWLCGRESGLDAESSFRALAAAVDGSPRPMLFNICNPVTPEWGDYPADQLATWTHTYAPAVADSWRTYTDVATIEPAAPGTAWTALLRNLDANAAHPEATSPGHYADPDYLIPTRPGELGFEASRSQLAMWAMMSAPLVLGSDPRTLSPQMLAALTNPEVLAVDQDPLVRPGVRVASPGADLEVWSKQRAGTGHRTVALFNRGSTAARIPLTVADTGLTGPVELRDLWERAGLGVVDGTFTAEVPAYGTLLLDVRSLRPAAASSQTGAGEAADRQGYEEQ